jgi:hypothetical protein
VPATISCISHGTPGTARYEADKAVETARKVMARRKVEMSAAYEEMLRGVAGERCNG